MKTRGKKGRSAVGEGKSSGEAGRRKIVGMSTGMVGGYRRGKVSRKCEERMKRAKKEHQQLEKVVMKRGMRKNVGMSTGTLDEKGA